MIKGKYKVCECGHRDDWHQRAIENAVLTDNQKPCYGTKGEGCACTGWRNAILYDNASVNAKIDGAHSLNDVVARIRGSRIPHIEVGAEE